MDRPKVSNDNFPGPEREKLAELRALVEYGNQVLQKRGVISEHFEEAQSSEDKTEITRARSGLQAMNEISQVVITADGLLQTSDTPGKLFLAVLINTSTSLKTLYTQIGELYPEVLPNSNDR